MPFEFRPRSYLHFDRPKGAEEAWTLVSNPAKVATHPFYPFLGYTLSTLRIKKDENGKVVKTLKDREIRIAAHADAAIYSYYSHVLTAFYEREIEQRELGSNVIAFRSLPSGGTNIEFAAEVFEFIRANRPCVALGFDLKKFFDTLCHKHLKRMWQSVLRADRLPSDHFAIYKSLTAYSYVERSKVYAKFGISPHNPKPRNKRRIRICGPKEFRDLVRGSNLILSNPNPGFGIPQGSPISAVLSNIYMLDFDSVMSRAVNGFSGLYRRYCDDIMIVVSPSHAAEVERLVMTEIEKVALKINEKKTDRVEFDLASKPVEPIQYLGFTFDGTAALIRQGSLCRFYGKMRRGVRLAKLTQRKHNLQEMRSGSVLSAMRVRKLHLQYSYLIGRRSKMRSATTAGHGNFLTYAYRAAGLLKSLAIRRQVRGHWTKLNAEITKPLSNQLRAPVDS